MSQKFKSELELQALNNATTDTDKFLVSDGGVVKYRTGAEMLSDLGVAPGVASNIQHQVKAGVAINKGQAVYVTSADGTNMIVGLASNASEATSSKTMGLLASTVSINGFANVIAEGLLAGLNTIGATAGDPVWLGTGGNLIYGLINKPYAPAHLVFIGIVTRVNSNNGEIFVKVQNGFELNEIHDVDLKTTTPINGDVLGFNGTLWVNKTIAGWLGYTPANASGTTNYVPKFTGTTSLGDSQIFDNGTNVGIGTTSPTQKLDVNGGNILVTSAAPYISLKTTQTGTPDWKLYNSYNVVGDFAIVGGTSVGNKFNIQPNGNIGIGTTTPGNLLTINGDTRIVTPQNSGLYAFDAATGGSFIWSITRSTSVNANDVNICALNGFAVRTGTSSRVNTGHQFYINTSGNVGIGTTSPVNSLQVSRDQTSDTAITVSNSGTVGATTTMSFVLQEAGTPQGWFRRYRDNSGLNEIGFSNDLAFSGNVTSTKTERMRITSAGNLGIGTSSPGYKTQIESSSSVVFLSKNTSSTSFNRSYFYNNSDVGIQIQTYGSAYPFGTLWPGGANSADITCNAANGLAIGTSTASAFVLGTNSAEKMRITSSGNVGIGTTSPATKLEVSGIASFTGSGGRSVVIEGQGAGRIDINGDGSAYAVGIKFNSSPGGTALSGIWNYGSGTSQQWLAIGGTAYNNAALYILPSGNVGIGTTSPTQKLDVVGNIKLPNSSQLMWRNAANNADIPVIQLTNTNQLNIGTTSSSVPSTIAIHTSATERLRITDTGNVGIGTSSPTKRLDVVSSTNDSFDAIVVRPLNQTQTLNIGWQGIATSLNFIVSTNGSEKMRVDTAGNVGIGTSSPSYKLQVNDTIATVTGFGNFTALQSAAGTGFRWTLNNDGTFRVQKTADGFFNISATPIMIDSSNRVGIGTTAPQRDLQVGAFSGSPEICIGSSTSGNGTLAFGDGASGNDPWRGYVQYNHSVDAMIFGTVNGEKVRITSAGYMGIGTTSPSYPLYVGTQVSNVSIYADYDIVAFSDQSVKENIRPIENVLERVIESRGVLYDRIDSGEKDNIGFIAQELEVAFPELVVTNEDGTKAVKYQNAVAVLFEAVKEQQKQIDEIKRILNGLTN
jgi:hypothetical protein